ncbi:hypothetical protein PMALA_074230 [Plasmodium malariae]|uniref:PIR Superfamily Protein n=1 Tax=Plasmodium malariae TaxID=5858 RepID=A0A1A8X8H9_PLAMA|nr:hypothetical protein PMALA_074230 [Plasmodium malariae]
MKGNYSGLGFGEGEYIKKPRFIEVNGYVRKEITSLHKLHDKEKFREKCLSLADYLIKAKDKTPEYVSQPQNWEQVLYNYLKAPFNNITNYGGCPLILYQNDKEFNSDCISKCNEYKTWFENRKIIFANNNRTFINSHYKTKNTQIKFPTGKNCNALNTHTFNKVPQCLFLDLSPSKKTTHHKHEKGKIERNYQTSETSQTSNKDLIAEKGQNSENSSDYQEPTQKDKHAEPPGNNEQQKEPLLKNPAAQTIIDKDVEPQPVVYSKISQISQQELSPGEPVNQKNSISLVSYKNEISVPPNKITSPELPVPTTVPITPGTTNNF